MPTAPHRCTHAHEDCCMPLFIACPACATDIPARRARLVKVTCPLCGTRLQVNMERGE